MTKTEGLGAMGEGADFTFTAHHLPPPTPLGKPVHESLETGPYTVWNSEEDAEAGCAECLNSYSHDRVVIKRGHLPALLAGMVAIIPINGGEYDLHLLIEPEEP